MVRTFHRASRTVSKIYGNSSFQSWNGTISDVPVMNQGDCASGWAVTAAEVATAQLLLDTQNPTNLSLSVQQIADCTYASNYNGCAGGYFWQGISFVINYGVTTSQSYPYYSGYYGYTGQCKYALPVYNPVKGYTNLYQNYNQYRYALEMQPISVAVDASSQIFRFYNSGVINEGCGNQLNHQLMAVGWPTNNETIAELQNSWGTQWGESGFVYLNGSATMGEGACGFLLNMQMTIGHNTTLGI